MASGGGIYSADGLEVTDIKPSSSQSLLGTLGLHKPQNEKLNEKAENENSSLKELNPAPDFIQNRNLIWNKLKADYIRSIQEKETVPIQIKLPFGVTVQGEAWKSTPYQIATGISEHFADKLVVVKVNEELWDLDRPLEKDSDLEPLDFSMEEAKAVFWHSTAHIMGEAMERLYGGHLCHGSPIENGFYYDMYLQEQQVSNADFPALEGVMKTIVKENQPFERLEMTKEDLMEMFKYNEFILRILKEKVTTPTTTVYKCGSLIDLCRGPHVRNTGKVTAFSITENSAAYWEGNTLQRIYGISFPVRKQLRELQIAQIFQREFLPKPPSRDPSQSEEEFKEDEKIWEKQWKKSCDERHDKAIQSVIDKNVDNIKAAIAEYHAILLKYIMSVEHVNIGKCPFCERTEERVEDCNFHIEYKHKIILFSEAFDYYRVLLYYGPAP